MYWKERKDPSRNLLSKLVNYFYSVLKVKALVDIPQTCRRQLDVDRVTSNFSLAAIIARQNLFASCDILLRLEIVKEDF